MDTPLALHEPWLDRLIAEPNPHKLQSIVLEAVQALSGSPGVAQWVEHAPGCFRIQRELGESHEDLDPEVVAQVARGRWDERQAQHYVLIIGERPQRLAWSIGLPAQHEDHLLHLEAFLYMVRTLHPEMNDGEGPSLLPSED